MVNRKGLILTLLFVTAAVVPARAQGLQDLGVGVIVGDPMGGTAKLWLNDTVAVDFGVGLSGDAAIWGDVLWHAWDLFPQPPQGRLGAYVGMGPRVEAANDTQFALRTMAGLTWRLPRHPIELFAEAGPVFRLTQGGAVDADGGVGVRFYFGKR